MLRENIKLLLVAVFCIVVAWAGPAAAHGVNHALFAHNADKVDSKHAVSYTSTAATRAGKLVATNGNGFLPNNIIAKAVDADKLDGLDSMALQRRVNASCSYGTALTGVLADGSPSCASFLPSNGTAVDATAVGGRTADQIRQRVANASAAGTFEQPFIVSPTSPTQVVEVSLTVPLAGTVQVDAVASLFINKANTASSSAEVGIGLSTQATDVFAHPGAAYWNLPAGTPAGHHANTFPATRTFDVEAGAHTFHVMAQGTDPTRLRSAVVNARFTPN